MKLATFNVNGINARLEILAQWLKTASPDAVALQETKTTDDTFPIEVIRSLGYEAFYSGQKSYNGTAILVRNKAFSRAELFAKNIPHYPDEATRAITVKLTETSGKSFLFIDAYFPNGQEVGSTKFLYKLDWIASLNLWIRELLQAGETVLLAGDFNIAPTDDDVYDPQGWAGNILVSAPERDAFAGLIQTGLVDLRMLLPHKAADYSWWDYRFQGFEKDKGLRIDHILANGPLACRLSSVTVDRTVRSMDRPSDHAPVIALFKDELQGSLF